MKPADDASLRQLVADGKVWLEIGRVEKAEGDASHYDLDGEDLLVDVRLSPSGVHVTARMSAAVGGPGWGIWAIPPEGAEVVVAIPDGDVQTNPVLIKVLASGTVHPDVAPTRIVIAAPNGGTIHATDETAGAAPLATKADLATLKAAITSAVIVAGDGGASFKTTLLAALNPPTTWPVGTTVLKAK